MLLLAKIGLGVAGTVALAGAYAFHEGVVRVDVDEFRPRGTHVHIWGPAAVIPAALHFVPDKQLRPALQEAGPFLPATRVLVREMGTYSDTTFVEVTNKGQHVQIRGKDGQFRVDVETPEESVHVACSPRMIEDVLGQLESRSRVTQ
jgi:hypothetical protein